MGDQKINKLHALPDMDYFKVYPAPVFEAVFNEAVSSINTTIMTYAPMLYFMARSIDAFNVLEIGMAQGWTSFFLASAVKDNGVRHKVKAMYYGNDIFEERQEVIDNLHARGLPATFLCKNSLDLKRSDFPADPDFKLDLAFIDGWHSTGHILREFDFIYPMIRDKGQGYIVLHDAYAFGEEAIKEIVKTYKKVEYIRFMNNYGLAIFRKMDDYDYEKSYWPSGPMKPEYPTKKECLR